ncbi:Pycsar system effector family protein [Haloarcula sp. 1CSR25-25]|jgi:hypothetical protein|uniref:Pycsar system effector family protein n=1 Tax=Haloarcula sp. 1CSR25-25 TaxID=2862545 RepID=UPI002895F036|nr:Pycsar system effector family protein [Haloarcula sp. 1CSR25-25]MDT3437954.1 hypothetical protein [Haloarcula sp. 1CSR25-25]
MTELSQFVEKTHEHLNEYINLADRKASVLLTALLAYLALYANVAAPVWSTSSICFKLLTALVGVAGLFGIGFAGWTVYPRTPETPQGLMLWDSITDMSNDSYRESLQDLDANGVVEELIDENYQLAKVASKKYQYLRFALIATGVMVILSILAALTSIFNP